MRSRKPPKWLMTALAWAWVAGMLAAFVVYGERYIPFGPDDTRERSFYRGP